MMSGKLIVNSVQAENFGGLSHRHLDIPGESMVVIHGHNETGKSTFSELITWLLVGPSTKPQVIRRLGRPDEILVGEMKGQLKGQAFTARGEFKITPKSWEISARSERVYEIDGLLTPQQWLHNLNDIDRDAMVGIYRIWGQQLHDGGDADTEMRRAGLGVIAMSVDPRVAVKKLIEQSKASAKIGEGDTSFNSISAELKEVAGAVALANNNIVNYNSKVSELNELEPQAAKLRQQGIVLSRRRATLVDLQKLHQLRRAESEAQAVLREQPAVPDGWMPAVDQIHQLHSVIEKCGQQRELLATARNDFATGVAVAGLASSTTPADVVKKVSITTHDTGLVGKAAADVGFAADAHRRAIETRRTIETRLTIVEDAAVQAAEELGTNPDRVRAAHLDPESRASAIIVVKRFADAESALAGAHDDLTSARGAVAAEVESVRLAELRWQQIGVGVPHREWRNRGGNRRTVAADSSAIRKLTPILAPAVAAIVAAVLSQWVLVALLVLAAIVVWAVGRSPVDIDDDPSVGEAADQFIGAEAKLDAAKTALAGVERTVAGREEQLNLARRHVAEVGPRLGIDLPDDPLAVADILSRWGDAADLIGEFDEVRVKLQEAVEQCNKTAEAERLKLAELDSKLTGFGLPAGVDPVVATDVANRYVELVRQAELVIDSQAAAAKADAELADLLGPVSDEVTDWRLVDIEQKADEAAKVHDQYMVAISEAKKVSDRIIDFIGDNTELAVLLDSGVDAVAVEAEISEIDLQSPDLVQQQQDLAEQTGVVKEEIKRLESEQQLADLRLTQGSLEEIRAEIGFEVAARRLAALVLQHVADEYERKNQPELIRRTGALALSIANQWTGVEVRIDGVNSTSLVVNLADGSAVPVAAMSTGARALLYLALRVAMAEHDTEVRGVALPLICDDPLVHLDDERAGEAMSLLAEASNSRQVIMFTCHDRTVKAAESMGITTRRI